MKTYALFGRREPQSVNPASDAFDELEFDARCRFFGLFVGADLLEGVGIGDVGYGHLGVGFAVVACRFTPAVRGYAVLLA